MDAISSQFQLADQGNKFRGWVSSNWNHRVCCAVIVLYNLYSCKALNQENAQNNILNGKAEEAPFGFSSFR